MSISCTPSARAARPVLDLRCGPGATGPAGRGYRVANARASNMLAAPFRDVVNGKLIMGPALSGISMTEPSARVKIIQCNQ
jgi:hypothetical protein